MCTIGNEYNVAIIGPGKVGTSFGILYARNGGRVIAVGGRNLDKTKAAAAQINGNVISTSMHDAAQSADYIIISVSDDAIQSVCETIAEEKGFREGSVVIHCSGALSSLVLASAHDKCTCHLGSMHPLQTFPDVSSALQKLPGAYCFYEGDRETLPFINHFAQVIGMIPVQIERNLKSLYHVSAVIACNYLIALFDAAIETASLSGIEPKDAWFALRPLIEATVQNVDTLGTTSALTGPIVRGDADTVRKHLRDLDNTAPEIGSLYRELGLRALSIASRRDALSPEQYRALLALLKS
jgi:predicted short-subunit dehydrogenase-like oxidoreductase (DUF2520 family)